MNFPKLKYRLKASSLVEVIVAMVILLLIFFIAIDFFISMNRSSFNIQQLNASNALEEFIYRTDSLRDFTNSKNEINGWVVSKEIQPYSVEDSIIQISYTVYKKDSAFIPLLTKQMIKSIRQLP